MFVKFLNLLLIQVIFLILMIFEVKKCAAVPVESHEYNITVIQYSAKMRKPIGFISKCSESEGTTPEIVSSEVAGPAVSVAEVVVPKITFNITEDLKSYMDPSAHPCDDFYQYACGNFENAVKHMETPMYDLHSFSNDKWVSNLKELLEEDDFEYGIDERMHDGVKKMKTLYKSCMNTKTQSKKGIEPLLELYDSLGGWHILNNNRKQEPFNWLRLTAKLASYDIDVLISQQVEDDEEDPGNTVIVVEPAFVLRSRHVNDSKFTNAYKKYVHHTLVLLGVDSEIAKQTSEEILEFSLELAKLFSTKLNSTESNGHRVTFKELQQARSRINWLQYFYIIYGRNIDTSQIITIKPYNMIYELPEFIGTKKPKIVANYLFWKLTERVMSYLDDRFEDALEKLQEGFEKVEILRGRSDILFFHLMDHFQGTLKNAYVNKYANLEVKEEISEMAFNIRETFKYFVDESDWITQSIKNELKKKINGINFQIGATDRIVSDTAIRRETQNLTILPDQCLKNILNVQRNNFRRPWESHDVFSKPDKNLISLHVTHLHYPYYQKDLPQSLLFGIIGQTIASQMVSLFNPLDRGHILEEGQSNLLNETFEEVAKCYVHQYDEYEIFGEHIEEKGTGNENIDEAGGISLAWHAYHRWVLENEWLNDQQTVAGLDLTPEQLVFLGYAYQMCAFIPTEIAKLKSGCSAPPKFQVISSVANSDEFADAFKCPKGSNMNLEYKCKLG